MTNPDLAAIEAAVDRCTYFGCDIHGLLLQGEEVVEAIGIVLNSAQPLIAEIQRLREIEAREAVTANAIVCILEVAQNPSKAAMNQLTEHLNLFDEQIAAAITQLGIRDQIRKREGAAEENDRWAAFWRGNEPRYVGPKDFKERAEEIRKGITT